MRGAVILRSLLLTLLLATGACEREAVKPKADPAQAFRPDPTAVNTSDVFCLDPEVLRTEPVGSEAIWARYRHWSFCSDDDRMQRRYLNILVGMDDPKALVAKSLSLRDENPVESARLFRRARELGWRERTRQDEMNELAEPPS